MVEHTAPPQTNRFRFDKSRNNFTIRRYQHTESFLLSPVFAAINVIRRARLLHIPPNEPIGQAKSKSGSITCVKDHHVRDIMRAACIRVYPDPNHYCRIHIKGIVAHSNWVTAAICLKMGGASDEEIAFRLRWQPGSVPPYLRESFHGITPIMQQAVWGAFMTH